MLSDKKIIEQLMIICDFFYQNDCNISQDVINQATRLINFIEYCNSNSIEISGNVIIEIMKFINIIETNINNKQIEFSKNKV